MQETSTRDRYVKVGNINTRYWQAGDSGSPVVLVHGVPGFLENWEKNIDVLAQHHRVYALDLLGFGRTDKLPLTKDIYTLAQFIADFLDTLNIAKANMIGNSMGGGLSLHFAIQFPQRVEKLVLANSAGLGPEVTIFLRLMSLPFLGNILVSHPTMESVGKIFKQVVYDPSLVTPDMVKLAYEYTSLPGAGKALYTTLHAGANILGQRPKYWKSMRHALGQITAPTLIFWGKQDRVLPVKHAEIAAGIPGSRLHIFDKCGHWIVGEYPEEFNKITLDFLAE
jgi:pimeloyl-ACP methyl ester carboxylesterase